jgi:hypothetical protein
MEEEEDDDDDDDGNDKVALYVRRLKCASTTP